MAEAVTVQSGDVLSVTASATRTKGDVNVLPDGRGGVYLQDATSGNQVGVDVTPGAIYDLLKTADLVFLAGQEVYWDHSTNTATYWAINDKDFFVGTCVRDCAGSDATVRVAINRRASCVYNMNGCGAEAAGRTAPVMTTAIGPTAGGIITHKAGGSFTVTYGTAAEAQKSDLISVRSVPVASKWIWSAVFTIIADGDADVIDTVFGMADATHASNPDTITTSAFFHLDMTGADPNIYAESDNATAEVSATDTTKDWAVGTPVHVMIDGRSGDGSGLKYYVNGIRVNSATAFTVAGAAGPLKALFLTEKSSNDSPGAVALEDMRIWQPEDAAA